MTIQTVTSTSSSIQSTSVPASWNNATGANYVEGIGCGGTSGAGTTASAGGTHTAGQSAGGQQTTGYDGGAGFKPSGNTSGGGGGGAGYSGLFVMTWTPPVIAPRKNVLLRM